MSRRLAIVLIMIVMTVSVDLFAQTSVNLRGDRLEEISAYTEETARNTEFGIWDAVSLAISVIALLFSFFTYWAQKGTETNTKKLSSDAQHNLLKDLIRHLYRNLVITFAIKTKLEECDYQGYPSEEHLSKLKIPMNNIHLDAFYGKDAEYQKMHNLYLNMRNYNDEIDIIINHVRNLNMGKDVIKRDMGTLLFKPGYLIDKIIDVMHFVWKTDSEKETVEQLYRAQKEKRNDKDNIPDQSAIEELNVSPNHVFHRVFPDEREFNDFMNRFYEDVKVDRGCNNQNAAKVHIIKGARLS